MLEARRASSDEAEELVASRTYSTTSHVCKVASGANDTRLLASDLRRAAFRLVASSSSFFGAVVLRIDLTVGIMDWIILVRAQLHLSFTLHTLRRFPESSFKGSIAFAPGPTLTLRAFFGLSEEIADIIGGAAARRPSDMFSLFELAAISSVSWQSSVCWRILKFECGRTR